VSSHGNPVPTIFFPNLNLVLVKSRNAPILACQSFNPVPARILNPVTHCNHGNHYNTHCNHGYPITGLDDSELSDIVETANTERRSSMVDMRAELDMMYTSSVTDIREVG